MLPAHAPTLPKTEHSEQQPRPSGSHAMSGAKIKIIQKFKIGKQEK